MLSPEASVYVRLGVNEHPELVATVLGGAQRRLARLHGGGSVSVRLVVRGEDAAVGMNRWLLEWTP